MQRESFVKYTGMQVRRGGMNRKSINKACVLAVAAAFAFATGTAFAQSPAVKEDHAQLKADQSALAREKAQMEAAEKTLKADTRSGKMAAESKDAEKVYKDSQYLRDERKDIAADNAKLYADQVH